MVVYLLECVPTGKKYVGKTVQSSHARWREHRTEARIGRKDTPLLRAIREHGTDAFIVTDLCGADCQKRLSDRERMWIRKLGTDDPERGYNVCTGGQGGKPKRHNPREALPEAHKEKIRDLLIAYYSARRNAIVCSVGGALNGK